MTVRHRQFLLPLIVLAFFALALATAACGSEEADGTGVAEEGEAVRVGDLAITVVSTRYLSPSDEQDAAYLGGGTEAGKGLTWLGVFLEVTNEGDKVGGTPVMAIKDSSGEEHAAFPSEYPTALSFGEEIEPGEQLPRPDATEGEDAPEGALLIFRVSKAEDPPLILEIDGYEARKAQVKLDVSAKSG